MRCLNALVTASFECQHAGTYRDPVTEKVRQFDIRGTFVDEALSLHVAVECKNLRPSRPLLVHAVQRHRTEAFHNLIVRPDVPNAAVRTTPIKAPQSLYRHGDFVGKKTDHVALKGDGSFMSSDSEVFDKISQSINSSVAVIADTYSTIPAHHLAAVLPVLVVPDGSLWQVDYDENGAIQTQARQVTMSTLFLGVTWTIAHIRSGGPFTLSHLEIISLGALPDRFAQWMTAPGLFANPGALLRQ